jgi:putative oxidoreductase
MSDPNGFFIVKEGWEYNLILAVSAVSVATIGPGKFSLDYALFHTSSLYDYLRGWWGLLISAALGLAGGIGQSSGARRRKPTADGTSPQQYHGHAC